MFKSLTLDQQVKELLEAVESRRKKVAVKVGHLRKEADQLQLQVQTETSKMVDLELADDNEGANKLRNSIRVARSRIEEIESEFQGYNGQMNARSSSFAKDIEKIKSEALKAEKDRIAAMTADRAEAEKLLQQAKDLEKKIDEINSRIRHSSDHMIVNSVRRVLDLIEPRLSKLPYLEGEECIRQWMKGENIERFFEKYVSKGTSVSYGPGHIHGYDSHVKPGGFTNVPR